MREDIVRDIQFNSIGVELGVASGQFSKRLLETGRFSLLYSIDAWEDHHDLKEMAQALILLAPFGSQSMVIRSRFSDVVETFPDCHFDFIYIDGYAHDGQDDGRTLRDWYPKLKPGGLFAGDDYSPKYPKVIEVVDRFAAEVGRSVEIHDFDHSKEDIWGQCPSWYFRR